MRIVTHISPRYNTNLSYSVELKETQLVVYISFKNILILYTYFYKNLRNAISEDFLDSFYTYSFLSGIANYLHSIS